MWSRNALVLMYHGFGVRAPKDDPEHLFISAGAFTAQLELLRKLRYRFLDVDDYLSGLDAGVWPRRSVLMTIDDGYPSVADIAGPVLARFDAPSVLFVPPDRLGRTSSWMPGMPGEAIMTADKLRAVGRFGIEVGAHGWDHSLMLGVTEADLAQHTTGAADVLERLIGRRPRTFAYPGGFHDETAKDSVYQAGYDCAFAVHEGRGRFAITRVDVNTTDRLASFAVKLTPGYTAIWHTAGRVPGLRPAVRKALSLVRL